MSKTYSSIFLLKNISDVSSLAHIFNKSHAELLPHVQKDEKQIANMPDSEKYFIYSWKEVSEIEEMKVPKLIFEEEDVLEQTIRFQKATANIEYTKKKRKDDNDNFLPKKERLNKSDVEVFFFEYEKSVYVLILTGNEYNTRRVKMLIGDENILSRNKEYMIDSDIFNWLFYIYTDKEGIIDNSITLENINGFVGNVTDDANVFTGTSYQTTELIVTKAFISNGGELKNITLRVRNSDVDLTCMINDCSTVIVNNSVSQKLRILDSLDKKTFFLLYLYGYLIPKLKQLYEEEAVKFINEENPKFSKRIGLEVIRSIIEKNNIGVEDLKFILGEDLPIEEEVV
ncbi:hypothetical protein P0E52_09870 [Enterococcus faecalis]|uniref:hypothetical protein n=1 Tax=Enterococcus TaxID=1350 RepID=UPI001928AE15|nr:hypothetical protein [Enterococcus faecalis]MDN3114299.1 hypothetical protein [Enterococcus faecalis]HBC4464412.1 hypothetical protein [Enterococcus faecalis]